MSMNRGSMDSVPFQELSSRVASFAFAVLLLTTVHHVYGAYVYHTPWRLHAAFVSGFAAAAIMGSLLVLRRQTSEVTRRIAFRLFAAVTLAIPVLLIGLFEGGYNHVLKDALYFSGAPLSLMTRLFPAPTYEMPNNVFFEVTGVMQLVPGMLTAWFLYRLLRLRLDAATSSPFTHRSDSDVLDAPPDAAARLRP